MCSLVLYRFLTNCVEELIYFILECDQNRDISDRYFDDIDLFNGGVNVILRIRIYEFIRQVFAVRSLVPV